MPLRDLIADLRHMTAAWDASPTGVLLGAMVRMPMYPGLKAVAYFRVSHWCWLHHLRPVALWLKARSVRVAGAEIHPAAVIGPGFAVMHSVGIVVGHEVVAGRDLVLYQGVTLGHGGRASGQPTIGDGVRIGAGAKVLGPVTVGDSARIGANSLVLAGVEAGGRVAGTWRG